MRAVRPAGDARGGQRRRQAVGASTGPGLAVLVGVTHDDDDQRARALARKVGGPAASFAASGQSPTRRRRPGRQPVHPVRRHPQGAAARVERRSAGTGGRAIVEASRRPCANRPRGPTGPVWGRHGRPWSTTGPDDAAARGMSPDVVEQVARGRLVERPDEVLLVRPALLVEGDGVQPDDVRAPLGLQLVAGAVEGKRRSPCSRRILRARRREARRQVDVGRQFLRRDHARLDPAGPGARSGWAGLRRRARDHHRRR